jgi:glutathione S-transferase
VRGEEMADFTLFTNPMSRGQIARWALHEVGADYDTQLVDWQNKPEALLDANPMGKVPTLVHHHNGHKHVVTECAAICHYLGVMQAPELTPQAEEMADYFRMLFFAAGPVEQAVVSRSMGWSVDDPQKQGILGFGTYDKAMDAFETLLGATMSAASVSRWRMFMSAVRSTGGLASVRSPSGRCSRIMPAG